MTTTDFTVSPAEERWMFGSVAAVADYEYRKLVFISTTIDQGALDWQTCLMELGLRFGEPGGDRCPG